MKYEATGQFEAVQKWKRRGKVGLIKCLLEVVMQRVCQKGSGGRQPGRRAPYPEVSQIRKARGKGDDRATGAVTWLRGMSLSWRQSRWVAPLAPCEEQSKSRSTHCARASDSHVIHMRDADKDEQMKCIPGHTSERKNYSLGSIQVTGIGLFIPSPVGTVSPQPAVVAPRKLLKRSSAPPKTNCGDLIASHVSRVVVSSNFQLR